MTLSVVLPGVLGVLALVAFVVTTLQSRPLPGGVLTEGTVVAVERRVSEVRTDSSVSSNSFRTDSRTYAPVVEFVDQQGATHRVTTSVSGGVRPEVGSTRTVSYLPSDPSKARLVGDRQGQVGRWLLLAAGIALLVVAVLVDRSA
ncbi:MAG: DUF3592 domain-containing protein [Motilibacteraceae bacterium]